MEHFNLKSSLNHTRKSSRASKALLNTLEKKEHYINDELIIIITIIIIIIFINSI